MSNTVQLTVANQSAAQSQNDHALILCELNAILPLVVLVVLVVLIVGVVGVVGVVGIVGVVGVE